ncbi:ABC transporter ATP-binding protein [Alteromonas sp. P256]|uniref:ABC transporter ATP-binding protein n=1 Tax=Alteromonas sp. P256 TaxID=3117399 RepID=UPI002FDF66BD
MLSVNHLQARYGNFVALHDVTLHVNTGQIVGILGSNGAGKSTLMKVLSGAHPVSSGAIQFCGEDMTSINDFHFHARGLSIVPEGRRLFSSLTIEENILTGKRKAMSQVNWTLERIYDTFPILAKKRKCNPSMLSGGQQQLAALCRGLIANPKLLLCDELSLGLSPNVVNEIYDALALVKQSGTSMLLVEQNMGRLLNTVDYMYCLLEGRVSLQGKPSELSQNDIKSAYFGETAA